MVLPWARSGGASPLYYGHGMDLRTAQLMALMSDDMRIMHDENERMWSRSTLLST